MKPFLEHFCIGLQHRAISPLPNRRGSSRWSIAIKNKNALEHHAQFFAFAHKFSHGISHWRAILERHPIGQQVWR